MLNSNDIKSLEVFHKDGGRMISVGINVCFYIEPPFEEISDRILAVYDAYLEICPNDKLVWYLTNSMEKHEKITKNTLSIPRTWLTSEKKIKKLLSFELKDSVSKYHSDAPEWKFRFLSRSRENTIFPESANYIDILFPCDFLDNSFKVFWDFIFHSSNTLPFLSGHAGYAFEVSRYYENRGGGDKALALSSRFKQIDIADPDFSEVVKEYKGIKGINWLNIISNDFVKKLKISKKSAFKNLIFIDIENGLIIQAGERPMVSDINRGESVEAYQDAYNLLKPLIVKTPCPLTISGEFEERMEKTYQWMHRFEKNV